MAERATLQDLQASFAEDAKINAANLGPEALRGQELTAKYLTHLSNFRLTARKARATLYKLRKAKAKYFRGEMSKEEYDALGWEPYRGPKVIAGAMDETISGEDDVMAATDRVEYMETVVGFLEGVVKSLNSRTWDIKNAQEIRKFENGGY